MAVATKYRYCVKHNLKPALIDAGGGRLVPVALATLGFVRVAPAGTVRGGSSTELRSQLFRLFPLALLKAERS
jgi:hypothetical protein